MAIDLTLMFLIVILLLIVIDICTDQDEGSLCQLVKKSRKKQKKGKKHRLKQKR